MQGRLTRLLRTVVLRTNSHWPFRQCNRIPYAAALHAFAWSFQRRREIRSVYVRHGRVEREWIPALSDIDLTVILQRSLSVEAEYEFLATFWRRFRRLKCVFPMLGEVEILNEGELAPWLAFSSCTPAGRHWSLLQGEEIAGLSAAGSPHWRRRALSFALWIYMGILPRSVSMPDSFLRRRSCRCGCTGRSRPQAGGTARTRMSAFPLVRPAPAAAR